MSSTDPASGGVPAAPKRRWVKPVLVVSLALNLLFVGLIAGSIWKYRHGKGRLAKHLAFEATLEQVIKEYPAGKRKTAEDVLARLRAEVIPRASGMRVARRAMIDAMQAEPYDEKAMSDALEELRNLRAEVRLGMHTLSLELIRGMTLDERKRLLEIYKSKRHTRGRRRDKSE